MWIRVVRQVPVLRRVFGHLDKVSILTRNLNECRQKPTNKAAYFFPNWLFVFRKLAVGWELARMRASGSQAIMPLGSLALGA